MWVLPIYFDSVKVDLEIIIFQPNTYLLQTPRRREEAEQLHFFKKILYDAFLDK
jgi:hypothetical protein